MGKEHPALCRLLPAILKPTLGVMLMCVAGTEQVVELEEAVVFPPINLHFGFPFALLELRRGVLYVLVWGERTHVGFGGQR